LTSSHQVATVTSVQTTHSRPTQAMTTSEESVSRPCGVISSLVTSSPLISGSAVTTKSPVTSIDACTSSTQASLSTSCVSATLTSLVSETKTSRISSNVAEQGTQDGIPDRCVPQTSGKDSDSLPHTSVEQVKEADDLALKRGDVMSAADSRVDADKHTASATNDSKTVTAMDEGAVQRRASLEKEKEPAADAVTSAADDSGILVSSKQAELTAKADKVTAASGAAVACSDTSTVSSKLSTTVDSSCLKVASDERTAQVLEQTAQESVTTSSLNKDDECDKSDRDRAMSGDVGQEKTAAETNETESSTSDGDKGIGSQKEAGPVQSDSASHVRDDVSDGVEDTTTKTSLVEQQLRQVMTLPADLRSLLNPSLPISLTLKHDQHHEITVPAANIYHSASGLQLLLPADSLPLDYIDGKQLVCTLGQSDDVSQLQQISISLTVH